MEGVLKISFGLDSSPRPPFTDGGSGPGRPRGQWESFAFTLSSTLTSAILQFPCIFLLSFPTFDNLKKHEKSHGHKGVGTRGRTNFWETVAFYSLGTFHNKNAGYAEQE